MLRPASRSMWQTDTLAANRLVHRVAPNLGDRLTNNMGYTRPRSQELDVLRRKKPERMKMTDTLRLHRHGIQHDLWNGPAKFEHGAWHVEPGRHHDE